MPQLLRRRKPSWSKNDLRRLGEALRKSTAPPANAPRYEDLLVWYMNLADEVLEWIENLEWEPLGLTVLSGTTRTKTLSTLVDKLRRDRNTPLQNVGDLAGIRIDADMTLPVQTAFADSLGSVIADEIGASNVLVKDLRTGDHSGYRAVHVLATFPAGRCEVQIRTRLQSEWANAYEYLADKVGRDIRYGHIPGERVDRERVLEMLSISRSIAELEELLALLDDETDNQLRTALGETDRLRLYAQEEEIEARMVRSLQALNEQEAETEEADD